MLPLHFVSSLTSKSKRITIAVKVESKMPNFKSQYALREALDKQHIIRIISGLNDNEEFKNRETALNAISDIVMAVHNGYYSSDSGAVLLDIIIQTLKTYPVLRHDMEISKSALAKKPLIMQLLILMQDIVIKHKNKRLQQKQALTTKTAMASN